MFLVRNSLQVLGFGFSLGTQWGGPAIADRFHEKAGAENGAGRLTRETLAFNVVFAQAFWAVRCALAQSSGLASRRSPLAEEPDAERSAVPAVQDAARFAVPEVRVASAPHKRAA